MWLEAIHQSEGYSDQCPSCGGHVRRRVFGEMHAGSFIQDGQRVEIRRIPDPGYADPIFLDPITQYFDGGLYRIWESDKYFKRGGKYLHRDVWRAAFGPIPDGCHIHHRDSNRANNRLDNLECLPAEIHLRETLAAQPKRTFNEKARSAAAEWHRSEAGRLWHRRHAARQENWTKWKREPKNCPECNSEFMALVRKSGHEQIYCSSACKVKAYRERGADAAATARYRERKKAERDG